MFPVISIHLSVTPPGIAQRTRKWRKRPLKAMQDVKMPGVM
jgi:hypothetical protein